MNRHSGVFFTIFLSFFALSACSPKKAELQFPAPKALQKTDDESNVTEDADGSTDEEAKEKIRKHPLVAEFKEKGIELDLKHPAFSLLNFSPEVCFEFLAKLDSVKPGYFELSGSLQQIIFATSPDYQLDLAQNTIRLNPRISAQDLADLAAAYKAARQLERQAPAYPINQASLPRPEILRRALEKLVTLIPELRELNIGNATISISDKLARGDNPGNPIEVDPDASLVDYRRFFKNLQFRFDTSEKFKSQQIDINASGSLDFSSEAGYDHLIRLIEANFEKFVAFQQNYGLNVIMLRAPLVWAPDIDYEFSAYRIELSSGIGQAELEIGLEASAIRSRISSQLKPVRIQVSEVRSVWEYERPLRLLESNFNLLYRKRGAIEVIRVVRAPTPLGLDTNSKALEVPYGVKESALIELLNSLPDTDIQ